MALQFSDSQNITQLVEQIRNLQKANERLRDIINYSSDGLYVVGPDGITLEANRAYEQMTGIPREEVVGKHIVDLESQDYFDRSAAWMALQSGQVTTIIQQIKKQKYFVVTATPVFDQNNTIKMIVTSVRDVTYLYHLQEQLRQAQHQYHGSSYPVFTDNAPLIYTSYSMKQIVKQIKQISSYPTTVLITGPSGTGKEVLANMIHQWSPAKNKPFIKINCASIPNELFESELFGYVSGSFTGAKKEGKPGLIELADQGTLLLDEIGEMPLAMQAKLLRVIQERIVTRIGDTKPRHISFRLICSTNQDLGELVKQKAFREDLWYRINVVHVTIPPLHERVDDIRPLAEHFTNELCQQYGLQKQLHPDAMKALEQYLWPGNIRELRNIIEFLVVSSRSVSIMSDDLPEHIKNHWEFEPSTVIAPTKAPSIETISLQEALRQYETTLIKETLSNSKSIRAAATRLSIDHASLLRKMKRLGIEVPRNEEKANETI